jgi:hypothetical protein
MCSVSA